MSRRAKPLLQDDSVAKSKPARPRDPAQPNLPFDPMPERIEPCLALLKPVPPKGPDWVFEVKWDGYRLAIHIEPKGVRIITRGGHDWTHRFPAIAEATSKLGVGTAILDGEAVVLDEEDGPISGRCSARSADAVASVRRRSRCFSLSTCSISMATTCRHRTLRAPASACRLSRRPHWRDPVVRGSVRGWRTSREGLFHGPRGDHRQASGSALSLRPHRRLAEDKMPPERKLHDRRLRAIADRGGLGSLAGRKGHDWIYVGSVGTGFNTKDAEYLRKTLDRLKTSKPAVPLKGKNLVFAQPTLIAEIEFRGWTHDGSLRHASYKGLREVQDNAAVSDMSERATL